jgi:hypothetical protein
LLRLLWDLPLILNLASERRGCELDIVLSRCAVTEFIFGGMMRLAWGGVYRFLWRGNWALLNLLWRRVLLTLKCLEVVSGRGWSGLGLIVDSGFRCLLWPLLCWNTAARWSLLDSVLLLHTRSRGVKLITGR